MPITTSLAGPPYNDDYDEDKKFVRMLWQPDRAVQTRELNQLQDYIQAQIERFGDNIFKRGTIIDGANFIFYDNYPYVKLLDVQLDGIAAVPSNYVGLFAKNSNGLTAYIVDSADGFESTNPDLKTIYVNYTNSGNSYSDTSFSAGDVLTIYDSNNSIFEFLTTSTGTAYANGDIVVVTPVLLANVSSGSIVVGDTITDADTGARGVVVSMVDETTRTAFANLFGTVAVTSTSNVVGTSTAFLSEFANGDYISIYANSTYYEAKKINVVSNDVFMNLTSNISFSNAASTFANTTDSRSFITYKPVDADLSNTSSNSNTWSFSVGSTLVGSSPSNLADVITIYGADAVGELTTDSAGRINEIVVTNQGDGYIKVPYASVFSSTGSGAFVNAQNFMAQVTVSSLAGSVGSGYAFGITGGVVYQKGYFIKVDPQTIIVDKYNNVPDGVTVGFSTTEEIINSNIDTSLFDNVVTGTTGAPGADRLKLQANLVVSDITSAESNVEFFDLVEWSNGYPFKQNNRTVYNIINDDAADRLSDLAGDFVVDRFLVTTTTSSNQSTTANTMTVVVDPGTAYVDGYKVQTLFNYNAGANKATDTKVQTNAQLSLNYQNYLRINNVGGFFEFTKADSISLYDTAVGFLANTAAIASGAVSPVGNLIGTARARNFVYEQGTQGSPNAIYRLYLFDINMAAGMSFRNVRSVYAGATSIKGIADVQLEYDATTNTNIAVVHANNNTLIFDTGFGSPLGANNVDFLYRTIDSTQSMSNTGVMTVTLTGSPGTQFPYTTTLSDAQKTDIILIPQANLFAYANLNGTVTTASNTTIVGSSSNFTAQVTAGQYLNFNGGTSNNNTRRVVAVVNSTCLTVDANLSFSQSTVPYRLAWPANVPIQMAFNSAITVNTTGSQENLNINLGSTLNVASNTAMLIAYNIENLNPTPTTKSPQRSQLVMLEISNNVGGTSGPWTLGVPDVFRLRNVYRGNSSVTTASSDVTSEFFVDNNQNSNYYNLSNLYKRAQSTITLTNDDYLLVSYDCYTTSPGFYTIGSYVSANATTRFTNDSLPLANLTSTVNTFEIPEVFDPIGNYYDLISSVDFRPYVVATANITSNTANITVNPANTVSFSSVARFFPVPDSIYRHDVTYFLPRIDSVVLDKNQKISVIEGVSGSNNAPQLASGTMRLNNLAIPAYPALPTRIDANTIGIVSTQVYSTKYNSTRLGNRTITTLFTDQDFAIQQPLNYTEEAIGQMDRRISNLEYAALLNLLQTSVTNRVIPSSVSPSIDRFKYGFFVDDYLDASFSEVDSPEYCATILNSFAMPLLVSFNMVHTGNITSSPYTTSVLVSQSSATTVPPPPAPPSSPTSYSGTLVIDPTYFKSQSYTVATTSSTTASASKSTTTSTGGGGKIVCTAMNEAYGFGSFRNAVWIQHSKDLDPAYEVGYHKMFLSLVERVYRSEKKDLWSSRLIRKVGERIARRRTADIWKQRHGKMDLEGRIYRTVLEPIVFLVGKVVINTRTKGN